MQMSMAYAGETAEVAVAEIELAFLSDILNGIPDGAGLSAFITATDGKLLAHTNPTLAARSLDMSKLPQVAALENFRAPIEIGATLDQRSVLTAAAKTARLNWLLFVEQPVSELLVRLSWIFTLGLVLCVGAGLLLAHARRPWVFHGKQF